MAKHFDVVVLGAGLGALTTAALLARRSWRVLVVGQGHRPPAYTFDGLPLLRRPFTFLAGSSPAWTRVLVELAQSQTWKRRVHQMSPMFQVLAPRVRLDVPPDAAVFGAEVDREYPEARRAIDELYEGLAETNAAVDAAVEKDIVWPPGGFWERREADRVFPTLPLLATPPGSTLPDLVPDLPQSHGYRDVIEATAMAACHVADLAHLPAFALARLHGAWTRGVVGLHRGEDELTEFLLERVRAHGGEVRLTDRVSQIIHRRGRVTGVLVDGDEAPTGVQFVATDSDARALLDLAEGFEPKVRTMEELPQLAPRAHRFVVSILVKSRGVPVGLAHDSFLLSRSGSRMPAIHLQRYEGPGRAQGSAPFHVPTLPRAASDSAEGDLEVLVAEAILSPGEASPKNLKDRREAVLAVIQEFLPFIERHYVIVDSPHDGRPLWDYRSGIRRDVERATLIRYGASVGPEPMVPCWEVAPPTFYGLGAEPIQTPLPGAFAVGPSVLPALGQEGELLAAWGAARRITRTDARKEKMRREMWSKVELG